MTEATGTTERVRAYRHPNGGGQKFYPSQASPDAFLDGQTTIEGETNVYGGRTTDSALRDTVAAVSGIDGSLVAGSSVVESYIRKSDIVSSQIISAYVAGCRLTKCRVFTNAGGQPRLFLVRLSGVTVYGDAILVGSWGLELEGAHIHAGVWRTPPRHTLIEGGGIHEAVVECTEGRAHMGCKCMPVSYWLAKGARIARRFGWDKRQIEQCQSFLETLK